MKYATNSPKHNRTKCPIDGDIPGGSRGWGGGPQREEGSRGFQRGRRVPEEEEGSRGFTGWEQSNI